ncbi:hypothetical protein JYT86_00330 [bacterium AH-315-N03]|nr:hypothetical protein [bacterium AH-315-N03]
MDRIRGMLDGLSSYWENLTDRERTLLSVLGAVAGVLVVALPVFLFTAAISDLDAENQEITTALRRISHARGRLAAQQAEQQAAELRYARRAPTLGSFLEAKAGEQEGIAISDVHHEPEREQGRFRIRHSRARYQNTGLVAGMQMLAAIENSRYPVAIERIHIDHNQVGDRYNFQIGVLAYDREGGGPDAGVPSASGEDEDRGGRAGPPAP